MKRTSIVFILISLLLLAACQNDDPAPTLVPTAELLELEATAVSETTSTDGESAAGVPTMAPTEPPVPTATPLPSKEMTICMANEPSTLFLYGDRSLAATAVRHAIYENIITSLAYEYQARGVEKVPSLADGDAVINEVAVQLGDPVLNSSGDAVILGSGMQIITADGEFLTFTGEEETPVMMQQMVVDFRLQPLVWSDGEPVTAVDSIFSFNLASDPAIANDKTKPNRTATYEAIDDRAVRWTGIPGFLDETYFLNVWTPLPAHQLSALTAFDMATAPELGEFPLSHGPFVVESWTRGAEMVLVRNPHYYEDVPQIGRLTILFDVDGLDGVVNGRCDIALQDSVSILEAADIAAAADAGDITPY
ncbi:MAG: hypothetical protein GY943_05835, partial [Chloroflexi bacterium]|nr:hypothetical protein [Chloroflexota bacterium]